MGTRLVTRLRASLKRVRTVVYLGVQFALVLVGALVAQYGPVGVAVGTSIIATGVSGMVVYAWVLVGDEEADRRRNIDTFGFVTAFPHRSVQIKHEYQARVGRASHRIDIMGFGLNSLREDFSGVFREWAARVEVRILLVAPDAPTRSHAFTALRDREEGNNPGRTDEEIRRFILQTEPLWRDPDIRFDVRLATTLPSVNLFRIDDECFWGPYLLARGKHGRASRNLPTMIVRRPGYMFDWLADHFDEIWASEDLSRPPSPEDLSRG
ncbi:hypothetical protein [Saccharothrix sp. Mg75]|uniref:hypothetical protein n=1 Tax=Saccharothrix sp. Mg75 TaxID=3445357 RepID=UPI003EE8BB60